MSYYDAANNSFIYACVGVGLLIILGFVIAYFIRCYKHGLEIGISKEIFKKVIKSTLYFSIVPSIAVVVGLVSLVTIIGIPYAWFRLSVLGSVAYEIMAANMAMSASNITSLEAATAHTFGVIMFAMALGITVGQIGNFFLVKKIHYGTVDMNNRDKRWGALGTTTFLTALVCAVIAPLILGGWTDALTFISSAGISVLITYLAKKFKADWLIDFTLATALIGSMALSVVFDKII